MSKISLKVTVHVYKSIRNPVIDKMAVCKLAKRLWSVNLQYWCTKNYYGHLWPDSLSCRAFITCSISTQALHFSVSSILKCFAAYWIPDIRQITQQNYLAKTDLEGSVFLCKNPVFMSVWVVVMSVQVMVIPLGITTTCTDITIT